MMAALRRAGLIPLLAAVVVLAPATPALGQAEGGPAPSVTAEAAILWDPADDRALAGKQARTALRPASTTKIMTVLLALERADPDDVVTVSASAVRGAAEAGAATLELQLGQEIPLGSLLAGLMLRSGNDAAVAVAEHVAGSQAAFVDLMNARARQLGLTDTAFLDATGLTDDPQHHSSPRDLARLADVAMTDPRFARWAGAQTLDVPGLGQLTNRNELLGSYPGATGIKTGYTRLAGLCLVASATRGGRQLLAVVLDSDNSFADAGTLLDYGFSSFRRAQPFNAGEVATSYRWSDATVPLLATETLGRTLPTMQKARYRVQLDAAVQRPVERGARLATAELLIGGTVVERVPLVAARAVPQPRPQPRGAAAAGTALQDALRSFAQVPSVARGI